MTSMTNKQYRSALVQLKLSQRAAARLLGTSEVTSRRWAKSGVSGTAAILLKLLLDGDVSVAKVAAASGTTVKTVRLGKLAPEE